MSLSQVNEECGSITNRREIAMTGKLTLSLILIAVVLPACSNPSGIDGKIQTVDMLLASVCKLAAACPGISATPADVDDCPLGIRSQLDQADLNELQQFTTYGKVQQDKILQCIGTTICARFGGRLANISDSDVMEPYRDCVASV